ncbi:general secretion pathway protein GspB [Ramlibacter sp. PS3R-8]|uniref:general secretion pathway protein GspB n=1 Tax=Ramlibacter sp. PS3R-8 TaxID=3133437 RepID=UPI0030982CDC
MSYILDALRRADAERERDPSRGIHAQPAAVLPRDAQPPREPWVLAGVAVVVAVAGGYLLVGPDRQRADAPVARVEAVKPAPVAVTPPAAPEVVPVAAVVLPPPPPAPARTAQRPAGTSDERVVVKAPVFARLAPTPPQPGVTSSDTAPPGAAPSAPPAAPPSVAPSAPPAMAPAARPAAAPSTAPAAGPSAAPSTAPTTGPSAAPSGAAAPASAAPAGRIVAVSELPADVQRELPKLVIAGGVHSENPSQRMLIVGGQVRSEGAELAPGLVLEQIRASSAVLRFKGWRYSVSF